MSIHLLSCIGMVVVVSTGSRCCGFAFAYRPNSHITLLRYCIAHFSHLCFDSCAKSFPFSSLQMTALRHTDFYSLRRSSSFLVLFASSIASILSSIFDDTSISSLLLSVMGGSSIPLISLLGSEVLLLLTYLSSFCASGRRLFIFHSTKCWHACFYRFFVFYVVVFNRVLILLGFFQDSRDTTFSPRFSFFLSLSFWSASSAASCHNWHWLSFFRSLSRAQWWFWAAPSLSFTDESDSCFLSWTLHSYLPSVSPFKLYKSMILFSWCCAAWFSAFGKLASVSPVQLYTSVILFT